MKCKLHIDGMAEGEIISENIVTIGSAGLFRGEISAKKLIISGIFEGKANCDRIELLKNGQIIGKIVSKDLMIESGSVFEGESELKKENMAENASEDL